MSVFGEEIGREVKMGMALRFDGGSFGWIREGVVVLACTSACQGTITAA